ncbi:STAS domain-containing protein [Glycomyces sp. TRM65418]|uniref:STAS domain-containing protein n=1 Tax=Glycomyces sp. TRM65418 TaxID=2867006 RepID=UPI001CE6DBB8|nr:STAS domain-containing protein [Glycomyces sp. TRM65418]MCC3763490.1 STAS domain-containing protein [Glycomyces sp. TRM65418]QZD57476.1 STAS domain-containing protein [Glycomyces sp. TRM65418]
MASIGYGGERDADTPRASGSEDGPLRAHQTEGPLPVLHVSGTVDLNSHKAWGRLLRQATVGDGELHLDLAQLAFIDMRGVSILVNVAGELPSGARIVVHGSPPHMRRMMEVLWPDGVDALTIKGDAQ